MKIHFLSDVLIAAASLNLQVPIIRFDSGTLLNNSRASVLLLNFGSVEARHVYWAFFK